jgi:hypothetical protein
MAHNVLEIATRDIGCQRAGPDLHAFHRGDVLMNLAITALSLTDLSLFITIVLMFIGASPAGRGKGYSHRGRQQRQER